MDVVIKFFASYRELLGEDEICFVMQEGSTVGDLLQALRDRFPALAQQGYAPLTAVNLSHVGKRHMLEDGDEVAIFPPVSGG